MSSNSALLTIVVALLGGGLVSAITSIVLKRMEQRGEATKKAVDTSYVSIQGYNESLEFWKNSLILAQGRLSELEVEVKVLRLRIRQLEEGDVTPSGPIT